MVGPCNKNRHALENRIVGPFLRNHENGNLIYKSTEPHVAFKLGRGGGRLWARNVTCKLACMGTEGQQTTHRILGGTGDLESRLVMWINGAYRGYAYTYYVSLTLQVQVLPATQPTLVWESFTMGMGCPLRTLQT